ncbi:MAG: cytochrome c [Acidimicrobiia bacterium]|nr:cytochrome c [Acidimicrobiia bacterium]
MGIRAFLLLLVLVLASCGGGGNDSLLAGGKSVYADTCSVCHGTAGEGGVGPSLDDVTATFPSCDDQIEWIALGSDGWKTERGDTYGASAKPVNGGMPAQIDILDPMEIAAVAAFERATYSGVPEAEAIAQCRLDVAEDEVLAE